MTNTDIRFNNKLFEEMIGKNFENYICQELIYSTSATQYIKMTISGKEYFLTNIQETVDYFGFKDDEAVFKIEKDKTNINLINPGILTTPINSIISKITIVNENQQLYRDGKLTHNLWITRAVIFDLGDREVLFEKDAVPFSEEIIVFRGYNTKERISDKNEFLTGWESEYIPKVNREIVVIE